MLLMAFSADFLYSCAAGTCFGKPLISVLGSQESLIRRSYSYNLAELYL